MRVFNKFRAFPMPAEMIASEQILSFINSVAHSTKEEFVYDLASKSTSD